MADTRLPRNESLKFKTTSTNHVLLLKLENNKLVAPPSGHELPTDKRGVYKLVVTDRGGESHEVKLTGPKATPTKFSKTGKRVSVTYEVF